MQHTIVKGKFKHVPIHYRKPVIFYLSLQDTMENHFQKFRHTLIQEKWTEPRWYNVYHVRLRTQRLFGSRTDGLYLYRTLVFYSEKKFLNELLLRIGSGFVKVPT